MLACANIADFFVGTLVFLSSSLLLSASEINSSNDGYTGEIKKTPWLKNLENQSFSLGNRENFKRYEDKTLL